MNDYRMLFVVGCPRSGTTWMQLLLAQSPGVATAPETQIFVYYLDHFRKQWIHEHEGPGSRLQGRAGLSRLLSEDEFRELCRHTALQVLDRIAEERPGAPWVLEKSPRNAELVDWILELFPKAAVLHVIRDPRDVVRSLVEAGRSWGRGWAPKGPVQAARLWRRVVLLGRGGRELTPHYREVRYEVLRRDPHGTLHGVLTWLGLPASDAAVDEAVRSCDLDKLRTSADASKPPVPGGKSPKGFFGGGEVGGWRGKLSRSAVKTIERECGDVMGELGYELAFPPGRRRTARALLADLITRVRESVDWQLHRFSDRL